MFRVNGRSIAPVRKGFITIAELLSWEVLEELLTWKCFMEQYFRGLSVTQVMQHDAYKRVNRRVKQIRHGTH
ncbi:MAG: hypothetical protein HPY74_19685 [Firmicutes bacterium]|nr:hypothetical protein [Bacillota bacterium]